MQFRQQLVFFSCMYLYPSFTDVYFDSAKAMRNKERRESSKRRESAFVPLSRHCVETYSHCVVLSTTQLQSCHKLLSPSILSSADKPPERQKCPLALNRRYDNVIKNDSLGRVICICICVITHKTMTSLHRGKQTRQFRQLRGY